MRMWHLCLVVRTRISWHSHTSLHCLQFSHLTPVVTVFARSLPAHPARPLNVLDLSEAPGPRSHPPLLLVLDAGAGQGGHLMLLLLRLLLQHVMLRRQVLRLKMVMTSCQGVQESIAGWQGDKTTLRGGQVTPGQVPGGRGEGVRGEDGWGGGQVQGSLFIPVHWAAHRLQEAGVTEAGGGERGERLLNCQHVLVLPGEDVGGVRGAGYQASLVHVQRNCLK